MRHVPPWESYVTRLCLDKWALEPASTIQILTRIESLVVPGAATDAAVATVLRRGGVAATEAGEIAPSICTAMRLAS